MASAAKVFYRFEAFCMGAGIRLHGQILRDSMKRPTVNGIDPNFADSIHFAGLGMLCMLPACRRQRFFREDRFTGASQLLSRRTSPG
jgi:hypothetical protein